VSFCRTSTKILTISEHWYAICSRSQVRPILPNWRCLASAGRHSDQLTIIPSKPY
jgi:hypothetical protein